MTLTVTSIHGLTNKDELRPGYGLKFNHIGKLVQGLNRYDLVIGIELPERWNDLKQVGHLLPQSYSTFCEKLLNDTVTKKVCYQLLPMIESYRYHERLYQNRISQKLEYDLVAILPDADGRNHLDKAELTGKRKYRFHIEEREPYNYKYVHELDLPNHLDAAYESNPDRLVQMRELVNKSLSNHDNQLDTLQDHVQRLLDRLEKQILQETQEAAARAAAEAEAEYERRVTDEIRGYSGRNQNLGFGISGRRKRNLSEEEYAEEAMREQTATVSASTVSRTTSPAPVIPTKSVQNLLNINQEDVGPTTIYQIENEQTDSSNLQGRGKSNIANIKVQDNSKNISSIRNPEIAWMQRKEFRGMIKQVWRKTRDEIQNWKDSRWVVRKYQQSKASSTYLRTQMWRWNLTGVGTLECAQALESFRAQCMKIVVKWYNGLEVEQNVYDTVHRDELDVRRNCNRRIKHRVQYLMNQYDTILRKVNENSTIPVLNEYVTKIWSSDRQAFSYMRAIWYAMTSEFTRWKESRWISRTIEPEEVDTDTLQKLLRARNLTGAGNEDCAVTLEQFRARYVWILTKWWSKELIEEYDVIEDLYKTIVKECKNEIKEKADKMMIMFRRNRGKILPSIRAHVGKTRDKRFAAAVAQVGGTLLKEGGKQLLGYALTKITTEALGGLVIDGVGSFINWQKDRAIKKGIELLQQRQDELKGKIMKVDKDLLSVARTTSTAVIGIWQRIVKQNAKITALAETLIEFNMRVMNVEEILVDHQHALRILAWGFGSLQTMLRRNLENYDILNDKAEILFNALDSLSTGRLNHHVVSASELTSYLKHIEEVVEEEYPGYEIAMKHLNTYYDMNMISFVTQASVLYVHIPVFLKLKTQPMLDLYQVRSELIPYEPAELKPDENGEWIGPYTQVNVEKEYMAIGDEMYLAFDQKELDHCKTIAGVYYCENILMAKHISEHTCASAIFHQRSRFGFEIV